MNILYKYYSPKLDIIKYLENPSVKLASTKSFNDPFEINIANALAKKLAESFVELISIDNQFNYGDIAEYTHLFKTISQDFGIVCLTETHRNILMWAHYASSHEGFCIGYKSNFLSSGQTNQNSSVELNLNPNRVIYDKKRFDPSNYRDKKTFTELMIQAMTIKSDEWMYEKEHRCIVPTKLAERFTVTEGHSEETSKKINELIKTGNIVAAQNEHTYLFKKGKPPFIPIGLNTREIVSRIDGATLLKDIEITSIQSIYFGSKASQNIIDATIELIKTSPTKYGHISIYKYELNKDDFELDLKCLLNEPSEFNIEGSIFNSTF